MQKKLSIYQRAAQNGVRFVGDCASVGIRRWEALMKGARKANREKVVRLAFRAGIIRDREEYLRELRNPYYNPYNHYVTRTHVVYVHSAIEHFIQVNN